MKRPKIPHVEAIKRSIESKRTAIGSRHIPSEIIKEIERDITLLEETIQFLYQAIDNVTLYH